MKPFRVATGITCVLALATVSGGASAAGTTDGQNFTARVLVSGLENPWEVAWGPDDHLWVTEKSGRRVTRVSVQDGQSETLVTIPDVHVTPNTQDGLLGMALHPELLDGTGNPYVYLAYSYNANLGGALDRRVKLVRYSYDEEARQLEDPVDLLTGLPGSNDHNSGRLTFGPDNRLYYTIGDQGHNQFGNYCREIRAQVLPTSDEVEAENWSAYQGKILRLELDGSVPDDNPVLDGVRSHIYSYGHRNAQGLAFGPDGQLYSSEHGPKSNDEINNIVAGENYGWPHVSGLIDDKAYTYANWSASEEVPCQSLTYSDFEIPPSVPRQLETSFDEPTIEPMRTFYTVPTSYNFQHPKCNPQFFICWPTAAPSSLAYYDADGGVRGWGDSLLMPSLKNGTVYRMRLTDEGTKVGPEVAMWSTVNRYRDIAVAPDGVTFFVATDSSGLAEDGAGRPTSSLDNRGAILEFKHRSP